MWRLTILLFLVSSVPFLPAQENNNKFACYAYPKTTESYKKKLWDGYEISLGPARNAAETEGADCTAAIYNGAGKVVFRTTGFGVIFDEKDTGMDFDGDGNGEVVFMTDQAGGAHCCWIYNIVTLLPKPHRLFDIGEGAAVDFVKDEKGKVVIWERVGGPTGYTSMAQQPYAERVYRVKDGKPVDATPEFAAEIFSPGKGDYDEWTSTLTPDNIKRLQSVKVVGSKSDDADDVVSALLSRALQRVLCHQYEQAEADLNLWPESTRDEMKEAFAASVKALSPESAARIAGVRPTK